MLTLHYTAIVKASRLLELPEEAQELHLEPGQSVSIHLDQIETETEISPNGKAIPNEGALAMLETIAQRQAGRRHTDASQTDALVKQGRAGALYGFE